MKRLVGAVGALLVFLAAGPAGAQTVPVPPAPETYPTAQFEPIEFSLDVGFVRHTVATERVLGLESIDPVSLLPAVFVHDLATGVTTRIVPPTLEDEPLELRGLSADGDVVLLSHQPLVLDADDETLVFVRSEDRVVRISAEDGPPPFGIGVSDDGVWAIISLRPGGGDQVWALYNIVTGMQSPFVVANPHSFSRDAAWFVEQSPDVRPTSSLLHRDGAAALDIFTDDPGASVAGFAVSNLRPDGTLRLVFSADEADLVGDCPEDPGCNRLFWIEVTDPTGTPALSEPVMLSVLPDGAQLAAAEFTIDAHGDFVTFFGTTLDDATFDDPSYFTVHVASGTIRRPFRGVNDEIAFAPALATTGAQFTIVGPGATETDPSIHYLVRAEPFDDAWGNAHEGAIRWAWETGVTSGCAEHRYCPTQTVTRAQMASLLVRAFDVAPSTVDAFIDDDGSVHEPAINALAAAGVTNGCGGDSYCPEETLSRAQMASLMVRLIGFGAGPDAFDDDAGSVHETAINALAAAGVTAGCGDDLFCPEDPMRRDQMATLLYRASVIGADS